MKLFFLLLAGSCLGIGFYGCTSGNAGLGTGKYYYPDAKILKQGLVNKYYRHYKAPDSYDTATDIEYHYFRTENRGELIFDYFDAGFEHIKTRKFKFQEDQVQLILEQDYFQKDSFEFELSELPYLRWVTHESSLFEKSVTRADKKKQTWKRWQRVARDTTILGRSAKLLEGDMIVTLDTSTTKFGFREVYVSGIGLFESILVQPGGGSRLELVEQIPVPLFRKQVATADKRIGYISPDKVLARKDGFQLCGDSDQILDYYNGTPDAGYIGGKRALERAVFPQIDKTLLRGESGYLTFRFVVNCRGEAGWFVLEQAGLDYQKKVFKSQAVTHLMNIVTRLESWQPTVVRGKSHDAYCYLTFKLKDGEIVDLLP